MPLQPGDTGLPVCAPAPSAARPHYTGRGDDGREPHLPAQRPDALVAPTRLPAGERTHGLLAASRGGRDLGRSAFRGCTVVPNGVDLSQWAVAPLPAEPIFAAWGRHVPQKGMDLLIDAFAEVRQVLPDSVLRIGGEGPESADLRRMAGDGVEFVGPLDRAGVQKLLKEARVAVVPSRLEPFGIVAVEAMAVGRTVVWSTNGGLGDATGGLGWGVVPRDRNALVNALLAAQQQPLDPEVVRRHAETLAWTRICDRYEEIYERQFF